MGYFKFLFLDMMALGRLKQEDLQLGVDLGCIGKPCLQKPKQTIIEKKTQQSQKPVSSLFITGMGLRWFYLLLLSRIRLQKFCSCIGLRQTLSIRPRKVLGCWSSLWRSIGSKQKSGPDCSTWENKGGRWWVFPRGSNFYYYHGLCRMLFHGDA